MSAGRVSAISAATAFARVWKSLFFTMSQAALVAAKKSAGLAAITGPRSAPRYRMRVITPITLLPPAMLSRDALGCPAQVRSPDHALVHRVHVRARLARKHLAEILVVGDGPVTAPAAWRVRIVDGARPPLLRRRVLAPDLPEGEEELLLGRESRAPGPRLSVRAERRERELQAADVRDVLAERQLPVDVHLVRRDVLVVLVRHAGGALLVGVGHLGRPPLAQVAVAVVLPAAVVESVGQLVTHHQPGPTEIRRVGGLGGEERYLQDARREHHLVLGGVVVGVDRRGR